MALALVQSTNLPSSVTLTKIPSSSEPKGSIMLCISPAIPSSMTRFSWLRALSPLDSMLEKPVQTLQSKVFPATSRNQGIKIRFVPRAMFERFMGKSMKVIVIAQEEARRVGHNFVGTELILLGLIGEGTGIAAKVLKSMGINLINARAEIEKTIGRNREFVGVEIHFTPRAKRIFELSLEEARQLGHSYIGSEHLLLGLLREGGGAAALVLENLGADPSNIRTQVIRMIGESEEAIGVVGGSSGNKMPTLEEYGANLAELTEEGKLDPVVGMQDQIELVTRIMRRLAKNNPCLIGELGVGETAIELVTRIMRRLAKNNPSLIGKLGVGETAIAEDLAQRIANWDVPETIEGEKDLTLFERLTGKAVKVIMLAKEETGRLGHNFVGTEQILLGLIGEDTGVAAKVLKSMGINLKDARVEVEKIIWRGGGFAAVEIPFTPRAKHVLALALEEARQLGHNYIGTEHLLLGLLRDGGGVAIRVLKNLGADPRHIQTQVMRMVGGGSSGNEMPTLEELGTKLDPAVGRRDHIERLT